MPLFALKFNGVAIGYICAADIDEAAVRALNIHGHGDYEVSMLRGKELDREIAESIEGTCQTEHDVAEQFETTPEVVLEACSNHDIEMCVSCNWWHSTADMLVLDDEWICQQCNSEDDE